MNSNNKMQSDRKKLGTYNHVEQSEVKQSAERRRWSENKYQEKEELYSKPY